MEKSGKKKLFIFLAIFIFGAIIIIANLKKSSGSKIVVQTDKVVRGDITAMVSGPAKIQPEVQVNISAKVSGQITRLGVNEGDYVKKGDFLVQLDREFYVAAVEQTESNYRYALAGFEKAKSEYERSQQLYANNLISKAELEIAKSGFKQAQAMVAQNLAALNQAKDNLSKTIIYSPMDGIVTKLNKKEGEMAMGSQFTLDVIMVISDMASMLAETEIDENDIVHVSIGDTAKISIDAFPDTSFMGIVKEIANTGTTIGRGTQEEVTNFLVKVSMLEVPKGLRPSMSATVDIMTETRKNTLKVPIQCVTVRKPIKSTAEQKASKDSLEEKSPAKKKDVEDEPVRVLFVVKDGVAHQVEVETGISSDSEWEILRGVEEGDEVVSGSYKVLSKQLKDGDNVKIDNSHKKYER